MLSVVLPEKLIGRTSILFIYLLIYFSLPGKSTIILQHWPIQFTFLSIDLKMIIMKFIPVLVLSDKLTLQIKEVHTIARVPGNLQVFSFNFPLTFQRKLGRCA